MTTMTEIENVTITDADKTSRYTNTRFTDVTFRLKSGDKIEFVDCDLTGCEFLNCNLSYMSMTNCTTLYADFDECNMNGIIIDSTTMTMSPFKRCDLRNSHIISSRLIQPIFESILFDDMNVAGTEFVNPKYSYSDLTGFEFDQVKV